MNTKEKILIADDSEINRAMLSDILSPDYEVLEASNGEEVVECLKQHSSEINLVILDIVMPKADGFEVLAVMNRNGWITGIAVPILPHPIHLKSFRTLLRTLKQPMAKNLNCMRRPIMVQSIS